MGGHMGDARVTARNLRVLESDPARGLLFIEGSVPGAKNGLLRICLSPKAERARVKAAKAQEKAD